MIPGAVRGHYDTVVPEEYVRNIGTHSFADHEERKRQRPTVIAVPHDGAWISACGGMMEAAEAEVGMESAQTAILEARKDALLELAGVVGMRAASRPIKMVKLFHVPIT